MGRPSAPTRVASAPRNFEDSPTHWNEPSSFCSFSVSHKDHAVLPIQVLDASGRVLFPFLNPRSRVKMTISRKSSRGSQSLLASGSSCYKFPFRFVVKSEMPSMLLQHFDLWGGDHLPLFFFIRHSSMFVEQSWHLRLNREISSARRSHQYFFCAQYCHGCYLQQPPAVAGRTSCFLFQPAVVHPTAEIDLQLPAGKLPSSLSFQTSFRGRPPTVRFITMCSNGNW